MVDRSDCPLRHKGNGNCLPHGGYCAAVSNEICEALQNAYDQGWFDAMELATKKLRRSVGRVISREDGYE